jgi:hypothetical protein
LCDLHIDGGSKTAYSRSCYKYEWKWLDENSSCRAYIDGNVLDLLLLPTTCKISSKSKRLRIEDADLIRNMQAETAFGDRNGCQPIRVVFPSKWPLGLDTLKQQYDANVEQRLMAFQSQHFDRMGPTMEFRLLGAVGYLTLDPLNVETILSSRFEGNRSSKIADAAAGSQLYL